MSPDAPIVVTDTDDLQRMFAANLTGLCVSLGFTADTDIMAASLIEIMRANCPPCDVRPVAEVAEVQSEAIAAAEVHSPCAADSPLPSDDEEA